MKAVKEGGDRWERTLSRYFAANGLPLNFVYQTRRFMGIAGHTFARLNPKKDVNVWARMPDYVNKYEKDGKQVVIFVTNRGYGDTVDDSLVVMRMNTFVPMIKALVDSDKERWHESANY
jgi:hypothetical protein